MPQARVIAHPYRVHVLVHTDRSAFARAMYTKAERAEAQPRLDGLAGACYMDTAKSEVYVGVFDNDLGTLVHELSHAVLFILRNAGIDVRSDDGEAAAYLQEYLFNRARRVIT